MSRCTFVAFIDESGDEGFKFAHGSSEWFVLSAVITHTAEELATVKLVDGVRDRINQLRQPEHRIPDRKPLHFRDFGHDQRKFYAESISQSNVRTITVMVNKRELANPEKFVADSRLYKHAVRLLVERARARGAAKRGGDQVQVTLDEKLLGANPRDSAPDVVELDRALTKLAEIDAEQARLVELRYFGGLSIEETAEALNISPATVKRHWTVAKAWLLRELQE